MLDAVSKPGVPDPQHLGVQVTLLVGEELADPGVDQIEHLFADGGSVDVGVARQDQPLEIARETTDVVAPGGEGHGRRRTRLREIASYPDADIDWSYSSVFGPRPVRAGLLGRIAKE